MSEFVAVMSLAKLADASVVTVEIGPHKVCVALWQGQPWAFQSLCPHDKAPLQEGLIQHCRITCPRHLASFDLQSGEVSAGWRVDDLRCYPARIRNGEIEVDSQSVIDNPPEGDKIVWDFT
ncbi:Rieske (2Fe-2S) protein [Salinicola peritrichatus]|uniref:Rieske (2Fe-2S) protein n=1 Tax=Salinicola peritrichatus TaxID=1267424 RepID=UPI000DA186F9|nr:Rieske 2Fe-2S domain-containing protein [Salinicola peritrichatus]